MYIWTWEKITLFHSLRNVLPSGRGGATTCPLHSPDVGVIRIFVLVGLCAAQKRSHYNSSNEESRMPQLQLLPNMVWSAHGNSLITGWMYAELQSEVLSNNTSQIKQEFLERTNLSTFLTLFKNVICIKTSVCPNITLVGNIVPILKHYHVQNNVSNKRIVYSSPWWWRQQSPLKPDYRALQPRRQPSSYRPPW
jgi:hypothetical protein